MNLAEKIYQRSLTLPEDDARAALDFIEFLQQRHSQQSASVPSQVSENAEQWKKQLASMPNVGNDEDFARHQDYGRDVSWDT